MIMKLIRKSLGGVVLGLNALFPPRQLVKRNAEDLRKIEPELSSLSVYEFKACPFCIKVRRELKRLGLPILLRDAIGDKAARDELLRAGSKIQVPCLRIQSADGVQWMYESNDIIKYLRSRFAPTS